MRIFVWKNILLFLLTIIVIGLSIIMYQGWLKYQNIEEQVRVLQNKNDSLLERNKEISKLVDESEEKNKREVRELEIEIQRLEVEKKKLLEVKALNAKKKAFTFYKAHHRVIDDEKYREINIPSDFSDFFSILTVKKGDTYQRLLSKTFSSEWLRLKKQKRKSLTDLIEKINRIARTRLKVGMKMVVPVDLKALDYSPFKKTISGWELQDISKKRDEKKDEFWSSFGNDYGNSLFRDKAVKDWNHILKIDLKRQYFALYKKGKLVYWGPISSGNLTHQTKTGFFINLWEKDDWYSEQYTAEMPNAVNFDSHGLFTHQGPLPGYPASHGCARMLWKDSKIIYDIAKNEVFPIILYR